MSEPSTKFQSALASIDAVNREDPRSDPHEVDEPFELAYSRRMTAWLNKLAPEASEELQLAARAQHISRWKIARQDFPDDTVGYQLWRTELALFHADITGPLLRKAGYDEPAVAQVRDLLLKKGIKTNPDCQTLEDVACLVFLEFYLAGFAAAHPEDKVVRILQQTWGKMSDQGHEAALKLQLDAVSSRLVDRALGG